MVDEAINCSGLLVRPSVEECYQTTISWARILRPIPTDWLVEALTMALRGHDREGMISPGRIVTAWDEIRVQIRRKQVEAEGERYLRPDTKDVPIGSTLAKRFFAAGLEAARRIRGISTPAGTAPSDESDVHAAMRAINGHQMTGRHDLAKAEAMRRQPDEVRATYPTPGPDTLDRLRGGGRRRDRRDAFIPAIDAATEERDR